ncbi:hypothetical protein MXD81_33375, partial [Microbacteriaceae bacterium K1510]|nr:hypothetical protein [Microbacteriaceae bacterium K1510]
LNIPFQKVFHEGGIGGDHSITDHKCAEVLVSSPLPLEGTLQWIYCRSVAERDTLLYLLGAQAHKWTDRTQVSTDLVVFQREYAFVVDVTLAENGVVFELNPRLDKKPLHVRVRAWDSNDKQMFDYQHSSMDAVPATARRWWHEHPFPDGSYLVQIDLEGHLAFKAKLSRGNQPF